MALTFSDVMVKQGEQIDVDFFNRRLQLIVSEIATAETMASL